MLIYVGELLEVESKDDFNSLVFRAERYDYRLKETVPYGEGIIVTDECKEFMNNYRKHIGETISIVVRPVIGKNKRDIYYLTQTDICDPAALLTA